MQCKIKEQNEKVKKNTKRTVKNNIGWGIGKK